MQAPPFKYGEIQNLTNFGIDQKFFKFNVTHLESERYISVRDVDATGQPQLTIIELFNKCNLVRRPGAKIEGCIMHLKENIVALKAPFEAGKGQILQIFNMDKKEKLKQIEFADNISFWRWVTEDILAVVTTTGVYHVSIQKPESKEQLIFERQGKLKESQVIGYVLGPDRKWCALFAISSPDGGQTVNGHIQLCLIEGNKQQTLEGHACTFGTAFIHNDTHRSSLFCYVEKKAGEAQSTVTITEISPPPQGCTKHKKLAEIIYDPSTPGDFPISLIVAEKYGMLYIVTKFGFVYIYELTTCEQIYKVRVSPQPLFSVSRNYANDGILALSKTGALYGAMIDEGQLLPHLLVNCKHLPNAQQLAFTIAGRYGLPGLQNIFVNQFNNFLVSGDYANAAKIASMSPGNLLRNAETINKFKGLPQTPGQPQPLLIYFQKLLERGKLNKLESLELCGPVLAQGKIDIVRTWVAGGKLEGCIELGDMVSKMDKAVALKIYEEAGAHQKVVQALNEVGRTQEAMAYAAKTGVNFDIGDSIKRMMDSNPEAALAFVKKTYETNKNINIHQIADMFLERHRNQQFTSLVFDCMRQNRPQDAPYQTKVLQLNINIAPQIVESILQMKIWNLYNKQKIAALCEQKGLYQRALENYTDIKDIKRVFLNSHALSPQLIAEFLGRMSAEDCLACMQEMLRFNRQSIQVVVNVALQQLNKLGAGNIVKMFELVGSYEAIFFFLGTIIDSTTDKEVHHKYIEAAGKCNNTTAIENVIRGKKDCYDADKVKDILIALKLTDPKPVIFLCDEHEQYDELTRYLYKNNFVRYIEIYLVKACKNRMAIPAVLGTLIDLECDEAYIKGILQTLRSTVPMDEVIEAFERRSKLSILQQWLEDRIAENVQLAAIHNAMAKIKIDTNQNPQQFLTKNLYYDPKVVGKFCEDRDPHLAVLAYKRNPGQCDQELIDCTNANNLYRIQAQYLVQRQSRDLWKIVLNKNNEHRKEIVDQVISTELPDSKNAEEVITAVQSFVQAELTVQLMALLQKIVLHNSQFSKYKKLQNLLIITAIKSDKNRVMDYLNRLDNYDGAEIAKIALDSKVGLNEEALVIYRKLGMHSQALDVLIENIQDLQRAEDYAEKVNQPQVWSKLGLTYLNNNKVSFAMEAFLKCKDHTFFIRVITQLEGETEGGEKDFKYPLFIKYLLMVRQATKDSLIDNALTYSYAKTDRLPDLENFLSNTNSADCQKVGDRCFASRLFEAAKKFYMIVKNNSKIASCLIQLKEFSQAIEAAKKANTPKTWKEVCMACVGAQEYKLANIAAMNIIIHPDQLQGIIRHYESLGVTNEMITLLEAGVSLQRAHIGIFTELAILYAKHRPEKLMQHCKSYMQKLNTIKLLRACQKYLLWKEAVYLYSHYNEFDQAVAIMIDHSPNAFNHETFLNLIYKVSSTDLHYKAINFYLEEQPLQINELLKKLANKIDLVKCVSLIRKLSIVELTEPFLRIVQQTNTKEINEALNQLYLEIQDYEKLRESIEKYPNFDSYNLAKATESHKLLEFRRIAAYLYRKNGKFQQSIHLSKNDEVYRDAIETAQESDNIKTIEQLLKFFVEKKQKQFFAAMLFTCYDYLRPDLVMEYAWRFDMYEFAMPFFIQFMSEARTRENELKREKEKDKDKQKIAPIDFVTHDLGMMMPGGPPMLTGPMYATNNMGGINPMAGINPMGFGTGMQQFNTGRGF